VQAWVEYGAGNTAEALGLMRHAADLEASTTKNPVTPGEVLPAAELLGDMLLEEAQYAEAIAAYESALTRSPNRANSLFGAGWAAEMSDAVDAAREYYGRLVESVIDSAEHPGITHARGFLEGS